MFREIYWMYFLEMFVISIGNCICFICSVDLDLGCYLVKMLVAYHVQYWCF